MELAMKELFPAERGVQISNDLLSTIVNNWERIVENLKEVIQRLMDNPELVGHMKDLFQNFL